MAFVSRVRLKLRYPRQNRRKPFLQEVLPDPQIAVGAGHEVNVDHKRFTGERAGEQARHVVVA